MITNQDYRHETMAQQQLCALYEVSSILSNGLDYTEAVRSILKILHEQAMLEHPMITLLDEAGEQLELDSVHTSGEANVRSHVAYKIGEGVIGMVLSESQSIVIPMISEDFRFADKLDLYDWGKPFIAVPIKASSNHILGVLAAQPSLANPELLAQFNRFMEMCANLIARTVVLSRNIHEQTSSLEQERDRLQRKVRSNYGLENMVGHSPAMQRVFEQIRMVSKWNSTVLIRGESGTGKELIANAIHYNSPRASGPFIKLNCAALPDNLLESELFGHEKGAFTGAIKQRKGRFEQADCGTLFLDEIGEISPAFQAKLLRVLQEGEFERVGGTRTQTVDVRIIAATNRNLEDEVQQGKFREDLYYRLNVMPIFPAALKERLEDLPELSQFLLDKLSKQQGRTLTLTDGAIRRMMSYDWPGNIRQLENLLERASVMSADGTIDQDLIILDGNAMPTRIGKSASVCSVETSLIDSDMDDRERVIAALEQAGWVQAKAARLLNMTPRQIAYRIQTMNIHMKQI
ncbi:nif-specific transcriptional activator NifA [Reinekea thalattae]|uniref:Nif-specific regulatory protein n=1 Tax=Reinekea thalattae TaxID=2593301 RepID=A0A5C8Z7Z0_9GAMM|nr:nif-specific transcriptional activator NifA [Reinekea thalattae]TXR53020.1 nif-specific transcriptional activator NifA [Reinekea thalattae]